MMVRVHACRLNDITSDKLVDGADKVHGLLGSYQFEGSTITVTRGDYSPLMKSMVDNLKMAQVSTGAL